MVHLPPNLQTEHIMNRVKLFVFSTLTATVMLVSSCGGGEEESTALDSGAFQKIMSSSSTPVMGMYVDLKQMLDKSGAREDLQLKLLLEGVLQQTKAMGVNVDSKIYVFAEGDDLNTSRVLVMAELTDAAKFSSTLKSNARATVSEEEGVSFAKMSLPGGSIGDISMVFNNNILIGAISMAGVSKDGLKAILERGKKGGEVKEVALKEFLGGNNDVGMFMRYDKIFGLVPKELMAMQTSQMGADAPDMDKIFAMYNDAWSNMSFNFSNGAVEMRAVSNFPEVGQYGFISDRGLPADFAMLASPTQDVFAYFGGSFNPENYIKYLTDMNILQKDQFGDELPIDLEELTSMFTGDFMITLWSVPNEGTEASITADLSDNFDALEESMDEEAEAILDELLADGEMNEGQQVDFKDVIVAIGLNDAGKVYNMMDTVSGIQKKGNYFTANGEMFYVIARNTMVVTANEDVAAEIASKQQLPSNTLVKSYLTNPLSGFINLAMAAEKDGLQDMDVSGREFIKMMDKIHMEGSMENIVIRLEMKDKRKNALRAIVEKASDNIPM